jgi:hypothetical protein
MSDHIEIVNLKKFMLGQHQLEEHEEAHLVRCSECMESMTRVTLQHLQEEDGRKAD